MTAHIINVWNYVDCVWVQNPFPLNWSLGKCIIFCEERRATGTECYVEGDLVGELAAKASISRAQAEIEYERPEWAA